MTEILRRFANKFVIVSAVTIVIASGLTGSSVSLVNVAASFTSDPMLKAINTFDNGDATADLSGNNSFLSGDPFNAVTNPSGGLKFDTSRTVTSGGKSLKVTQNTAYASWNATTLGTNSTPVHASVYVWFDAIPTTTVRLIQFDNNGSRVAHVDVVGGTGRIRVVDTASASASGSQAIVPGRWSRIETRVTPGAEIQAKLFNLGAALEEPATTPDPVTRASTGITATVTTIRFGSNTGTGAVTPFWLDNTSARLDAYVGKFATPAPVVASTETFDENTFGHFNKVTGVGAGTTLASTSTITGPYSLRFDQTVGGAAANTSAEMTQAVHGTDKRYSFISFKYRHDGTPAANVNQPVLSVRNTNYVTSNGGGNLNIWVDPDDGTFRGDLMSANAFFSTAGLFVPGNTYLVEVAVAFDADGSSAARVRINGSKIADIQSTTVMTNPPNPPPGAVKAMMRSVLLGSGAANASYKVTYDDVTVVTSSVPLDAF